MKWKDILHAAREYPKLCKALEVTSSELDITRTKCEDLDEQCFMLRMENDGLRTDGDAMSRRIEDMEKKTSALWSALQSFCPQLDTTEKLKQLYGCVAPQYDEEGFKLFRAAQKVTGITNLEAKFPYEDACGYFEDADGHRLLRYLTAAHFQAVQWEALPGTTYERTELLDIDTSTPEYRDFERRIYAEVLQDMGFQDLLPQEVQMDKHNEKKKEGEERLKKSQGSARILSGS